MSAQQRRTAPDPFRGRRRWAAVAAVGSGLLVLAASFLVWLQVQDPAGTLTVTGWGLLGGATELAGTNINEVFAAVDADTSYRPAQFVSALSAFTLLSGLVLFVRSSRFAGLGLVVTGTVTAGWGLLRVFVLGDTAQVLTDQTSTTGAGIAPYLVAGAGLVALAAGTACLAGLLGPAPGPRTG